MLLIVFLGVKKGLKLYIEPKMKIRANLFIILASSIINFYGRLSVLGFYFHSVAEKLFIPRYMFHK